MTTYKLVYDDVIKHTSERLIIDVVTETYVKCEDYNKALNEQRKNKDNVITTLENSYDKDVDMLVMKITRMPKYGGVEVKYI